MVEVYEINMNITISDLNFPTKLITSELSFVIYINDPTLVQESEIAGITSVGADFSVLVTSTFTVGRTILLRLNANWRDLYIIKNRRYNYV